MQERSVGQRMTADLHFYFDPVCPFAWMASRWVHEVAAQRTYEVDWRFISLRILNEAVDYDERFPPGYEAGHTAGLRMLRMAARARQEHGRDAVGRLYTSLGEHIWDVDPPEDRDAFEELRATPAHVTPALDRAGLPADLANALDDPDWDEVIRAETEEALELTGRDVGTPILHFRPPEGLAFFGPVISRIPRGEEAVELWNHVVGLSQFAGFAELKRSLREQPRLRVMGYRPDQEPAVDEWYGGSRRLPT